MHLSEVTSYKIHTSVRLMRKVFSDGSTYLKSLDVLQMYSMYLIFSTIFFTFLSPNSLFIDRIKHFFSQSNIFPSNRLSLLVLTGELNWQFLFWSVIIHNWETLFALSSTQRMHCVSVLRARSHLSISCRINCCFQKFYKIFWKSEESC